MMGWNQGDREHVSACHFCGVALDPKMRIVRDTTCPECTRDLHACLQCRFYDPHAHNQCREPQAEWVTDRERRNFCDYFSLNTSAAGRRAGPNREQAARSKLDQLFGPKGAEPKKPSKPDQLFKNPDPSSE